MKIRNPAGTNDTSIHNLLLFGLFCLLGVLSPVQGAEQSKKDLWSAQVGAGTAVSPLYSGSSIYGLSVLPFLRISYRERFSFGPQGLNLQMPTRNAYDARIGLVYHPGRDKISDNDWGTGRDERLRELDSVDGAFGTQLGFTYKQLPVTVESTLTKFVGEDINGTRLSLKFSKPFPLSRRWILIPESGLSWASSEYTNQLFGITQYEASRSRYRRFNGDSGFNRVNLGLQSRMQLSSRWFFRTGLRVEKLLGSTADSPVTREDSIVAVLTGFAYSL